MKRRASLVFLVCAALGSALALWPLPSSARSQIDLAWSVKDVFPIAVRFVRVDRGCKVTDRDEGAGYIVFECADSDTPDGKPDGKKPPRRGAIELVVTEVQGRPGVRAQVSLADEPRYIELRFLELLERKIRDERGYPTTRRPPSTSPGGNDPPDAGAE